MVPCVAVACNIGACVWMYIVVYHYQCYYDIILPVIMDYWVPSPRLDVFSDGFEV